MYAYRASKAGVNAIFKSMGVDLKEKGVAVFVLHPGIVRTVRILLCLGMFELG